MTLELSSIRVFISSLSAKVPLVEAFRAMFKQKGIPLVIHGGDCNPNCLGRHFVDHFWTMPADEELEEKDVISYCKTHRIDAIVPTRDGELLFFAKLKDDLRSIGTFILGSPASGVEICLDKLAFHQACSATSIQTETNLEKIRSPFYVVKERYGSGSRDILIKASKSEALSHADQRQAPVFQPWIDGQEYSVDLYLTKSGHELGAIVRSRDVIINGEAQISTTVNFPKLRETCVEMAKQLQLTGHLVVQALVDKQSRIHIIECNCRIGGASTLSFAAGLLTPIWLFCESKGIPLGQYSFKRSPFELKQIRHATDTIIKMEG